MRSLDTYFVPSEPIDGPRTFDRGKSRPGPDAVAQPAPYGASNEHDEGHEEQMMQQTALITGASVSYTHLTLPTILLV